MPKMHYFNLLFNIIDSLLVYFHEKIVVFHIFIAIKICVFYIILGFKICVFCQILIIKDASKLQKAVLLRFGSMVQLMY